MSSERHVSGWPVGGEWRYTQEWASPDALYSRQFALWQSAISMCMRASGFEYEPTDYWDSDVIYGQLNPLNREVADEFGYGEPPDPVLPPTGSNDTSAAFSTSLGGTDGCASRAQRFVFNAPAAERFASIQSALIASADSAIGGFVGTDEARSRLAAWSRCMRDEGFDYANPDEPRLRFGGDPEVTSDEAAVRLADYDCDVDVGLTQSRSQYESGRIASWLDDNAQEVAVVSQQLEHARNEVVELSEALDRQGASALPTPAPVSGEVSVSTLPRPNE